MGVTEGDCLEEQEREKRYQILRGGKRKEEDCVEYRIRKKYEIQKEIGSGKRKKEDYVHVEYRTRTKQKKLDTGGDCAEYRIRTEQKNVKYRRRLCRIQDQEKTKKL